MRKDGKLSFELTKRVWLKRKNYYDLGCAWELPDNSERLDIFFAASNFLNIINHLVRMGQIPYDYRAVAFHNTAHITSMLDMRNMGLSVQDLKEFHDNLLDHGDPISVWYIREARRNNFFHQLEQEALYSSAGAERRASKIKEVL